MKKAKTALTPIRLVGRTLDGSQIWEYRCACGNIKNIRLASVKHGHTRSCGCLQRLVAKQQATHCLSRHPIYDVWKAAKQRCFNPNNPRYKVYGKRGITMCKRWLTFANFYSDMGSTWVKGLMLERVNNNKGYSPENCKWATRAEQRKNQRNHGPKGWTWEMMGRR